MKNTMRCLEAMRSIAIIAIVAVIGFSFAACDNGTGGGGDGGGLNGTWVNDSGETWVLNNGSFTASDGGDEFAKGTYSTSGSNITITITQVKGAVFGSDGVEMGLSPTQWYTRQQLRTAIINYAVSEGLSQSEAAEIADEMLDGIFVTLTGTYSGNTLTIDGDTFTRQGGSGDGGDDGGGGGGPGQLTITGLPKTVTGWNVYVYPAGTNISALDGYEDIEEAYCFSDEEEGTIVFDLELNGEYGLWTGSGNRPVVLTGSAGYPNYTYYALWTTVNFTNGTATVPYSRFTSIR